MLILDILIKFGTWLKKCLVAANAAGLTDDIIKLAYSWAKIAAVQLTDNAERREFVVRILVSKGIPESVARFAVEAALQIIKQETKNAETV